MKVKELYFGRYQIVAAMDGDECPAETFLCTDDASTKAMRQGLLYMLKRLAEEGFEGIPAKWSHEANKQKEVYEFIKGDLRLFYFKGADRQIAVCTGGVRKSGQKADKASVSRAADCRHDYFAAVTNGTLKVIEDETE